jgi:Lon protease-like protein
MSDQIALFPLKTVLLPGNQLPLKIFEARYTDMVADCMRENKPFGIVQIYTGDETDYEVEIFTIGTTAVITDWQNRDDGLLGVTALGQHRFEIISTTTLNSGLLTAEVEILDDPENEPVPEQYAYMSELLRHVTSHKPETVIGDDFTMVVYQLIYAPPR